MPKPSAKKSKSKGGKEPSAAPEVKSSIPKSIQPNGSGVKLVVSVKPNSKTNSVECVDDEAVSLHIAAEPKDGKANSELLEYVAEVLGVHKRDVSVDKGSRSHGKLVLVSGIGAENAYERLKKEIA